MLSDIKQKPVMNNFHMVICIVPIGGLPLLGYP